MEDQKNVIEAQAVPAGWMTTSEMTAAYAVDSFCAPVVFVKRRADGVRGTLQFTHMPRYYFNFIAS